MEAQVLIPVTTLYIRYIHFCFTSNVEELCILEKDNLLRQLFCSTI